jgi:hypothetical protein
LIELSGYAELPWVSGVVFVYLIGVILFLAFIYLIFGEHDA